MPQNAKNSNMKIKKWSMVGFCERLPSHPTTLNASSQLLVGQLTRLPFHSGYATGLKRCGLIPLDIRRSMRDMVQALKNIIAKEAVYSGRGSLNGHQTRQLRTNVK